MSDYWAEQEYTCAPTDPNPIDTEALAKRAGRILFTDGPEQPAATAREVCVLLDRLAAAEHRATRAERTAATGLAATHRAIAVQARADGDSGRAHLHDWAATQADLYIEEKNR